MRTRISKTGKLASVILSVVMVLNSIGISALAAGSTFKVFVNSKTGNFAEHVHIEAAVWEDTQDQLNSNSSLQIYDLVKSPDQLDFSSSDDITVNKSEPNEGYLYTRCTVDEGYELQWIKAKTGENAFLPLTPAFTGVDNVYYVGQSDVDVTFEVSLTAFDYNINSVINDGVTNADDYGSVSYYVDGNEITPSDALKGHAGETIEVHAVPADGCTISDISVSTVEGGDKISCNKSGDYYTFKMPAESVNVNVNFSTDSYYTVDYGRDFTADGEHHVDLLPGERDYLKDTMTVWGAGKDFYMVDGKVTFNSKVTLTGNTNIVLCDGSELILNETVDLNGFELKIYGQDGNTGKLYIKHAGRKGGSAVVGSGILWIHAGNIELQGIAGNYPAIDDNIEVFYAEGLAAFINGELVTKNELNSLAHSEVIDNDNIRISVCEHPLDARSVYFDPEDHDYHLVKKCIYCDGASAIEQEHVFDDNGKCICGQQRYHVINNDTSVSVVTKLGGNEQEWILPGNIVSVYVDDGEGYISEATATSNGNNIELAGRGLSDDPYEFRMPEGNVEFTFNKIAVKKVNSSAYEHGKLYVKNAYGIFDLVDSEHSTVVVPNTGKLVFYFEADDGYTFDPSNCKMEFEPNSKLPITNGYYNKTTGYYERVMPDDDVTITGVNFIKAPDQYSITVPAANNGSVFTDVDKAAEGSTVTVYVSPDDGYYLTKLSFGKGKETSTVVINTVEGQTAYTLVMPNSDIRIYALFEAKENDVVWTDTEQYTITGNKKAATDSSVNLSIEPAEYVVIDSVSYTYSINGSSVTKDATLGNDGKISFTMPAANVTLAVESHYEYNFAITVADGIPVTASKEVAEPGDKIELSCQPESNKRFKKYVVTKADGTAVPVNDNGTFEMPDGPVTVSAVFADLYTVTAEELNGCTIRFYNQDDEETALFEEGDYVRIKLDLEGGYRLNAGFNEEWIIVKDKDDNDVEVNQYATTGSYPFMMPASDCTVALRDYSLEKETRFSITWKATGFTDSYSEYFPDVDKNAGYYEGQTINFKVLNPEAVLSCEYVNTADQYASYQPCTKTDDGYSFVMPRGVVEVRVTYGVSYYNPATDTIEFPDSVADSIYSSDDFRLTTGWYYTDAHGAGDNIAGTVTISSGATVNLILTDGHTEKHSNIVLEQGATLKIWGQKDQTGELICDATSLTTNSAGIGFVPDATDGQIYIYGGNIIATGNNGAGIGQVNKIDSYSNPESIHTTVSIDYGNVTATGGEYAAGIGCARYSYIRNIFVHGGTVKATGGRLAAGIGSGYEGVPGSAKAVDIMILGGNTTAIGGEGGAGVGSGSDASSGETYIQINKATVVATGGNGGAGIGLGYHSSKSPCPITISNSTVDATGGQKGAGIGSGDQYGSGDEGIVRTVDITNSTVTATGEADGRVAGAGIGGGAYSCGFNVIRIVGSTVKAYRGFETAEAIGRGSNEDDVGEQLNSGDLNLPSNGMVVYIGNSRYYFDKTPVAIDERIEACRDNAACMITECVEHNQIYRCVSAYTHSLVCSYCNYPIDSEEHSFDENGTCVCDAYEIRFDANGGRGTMESVPKEAGFEGTYQIPSCGFTAVEGMKFTGWKLNGEGDLIEDNGSIDVSGPVTLVAQWEPLSNVAHRVTWIGNNDPDGEKRSHLKVDGLTYDQEVYEGCLVEFTVTTDDGWALSRSIISYRVDLGGGASTSRKIDYSDGKYSFIMPNQDVELTIDVQRSFDIELTVEGPGTAIVTDYGGTQIDSECAGNYIYIPVTYDELSTRVKTIEVKCGNDVITPDVTRWQTTYQTAYRPDKYRVGIPISATGDKITVNVLFVETYDINWGNTVHGDFAKRSIGRGDQYNPRIISGEAVEFSVTHDEGYQTQSVTVTAVGSGDIIRVVPLGSDKYSFVMPECAVNVDAVFTKLVDISYDANGGSGTILGTSVMSGTSFKLPDCTFTPPAGQVFKEWKIGDNVYQPGDTPIVREDTVVTAIWMSTWDSVRAALAEGNDVVLLNDISGEGKANLEIPEGITSSLDLNGFIVDRADSTSNAVAVMGTFTLKDTSEGATGTVTGARYGVAVGSVSAGERSFTLDGGIIKDNSADGVHVFSGSFTMNGGIITGHAIESEIPGQFHGGYGVWLAGTFVMNGGSISGNKCGVNIYSGEATINDGEITGNVGFTGVDNKRGGGAGINIDNEICNGGTLNLYGGAITNNISHLSYGTIYGGGIYVGNGSINIKGAPVVSGNKYGSYDCNIRLENGIKLNITGELTNETPFGVVLHYSQSYLFGDSLDATAGEFTSGLKGNGTADNFVSDSDSFIVGVTAEGEAIIGESKNVSFVSGSDEITGSMDDVTVASGSSFELPANGFVTPVGKAFAGWQIGDDTADVRPAGSLLEVTDDIELTATWKDDVEYASIQSATVSFDEKLKLNYYIDIPEAFRDGSYAVLTCGENSETIYVSEAQYFDTSEAKGYKFSYTLLAQQIEDVVNIKIFDKNGDAVKLMNSAGTREYTTTGIDYTILRYVDYMISYGSKTMKVLAQAAKDYCYSAKKHFVGGECPVSDAVNAVTLEDFNDYISKRSGTMPTGVSIDSISALFGSDNSFRLYLKFKDVDPKSLTYKLDGEDTELIEESGIYYLTFTGIVSTKLDEEHTLTIADGTSTYDLTVSVLTYARAVVGQSTSSTMVPLAKALYLYSKAADAHFKYN